MTTNNTDTTKQPQVGDVELDKILDQLYCDAWMKGRVAERVQTGIRTNFTTAKQAIRTKYISREQHQHDIERAEGQGKFIAVSLLNEHIGYLLVHRLQGGLPEMTAEVIGNLWSATKKILEENDIHMRRELGLEGDTHE